MTKPISEYSAYHKKRLKFATSGPPKGVSIM